MIEERKRRDEEEFGMFILVLFVIFFSILVICIFSGIMDFLEVRITFFAILLIMIPLLISLWNKLNRKVTMFNNMIKNGEILYAKIDKNSIKTSKGWYGIELSCSFFDENESKVYLYKGKTWNIRNGYRRYEKLKSQEFVPVLTDKKNRNKYYVLLQEMINNDFNKLYTRV